MELTDVKLLKAPPLAVTSLRAKSVAASDNVKVIVAVSPEVNDVSVVVIEIVGGVVSDGDGDGVGDGEGVGAGDGEGVGAGVGVGVGEDCKPSVPDPNDASPLLKSNWSKPTPSFSTLQSWKSVARVVMLPASICNPDKPKSSA